MKYLLLITILLTGCNFIDECEPGESEACSCGMNSYMNYCTMDGEFLECNCYYNGGTGYETTVSTEGGTMTGGDQESLNEVFPTSPQSNCNNDEVGIPGTTICWRICPAGMDMVNDTCIGYPMYQTYQHIADKCKGYHQNYRLPTMKEINYLIDECYPQTFSVQTTNFCSPYLTSPIRYTMQLPNVATFSTWVDEMVECDDAYGQIDNNCAWDATFYLITQLNTEFNLFRASAQYGSAMSSGICIRN